MEVPVSQSRQRKRFPHLTRLSTEAGERQMNLTEEVAALSYMLLRLILRGKEPLSQTQRKTMSPLTGIDRHHSDYGRPVQVSLKFKEG